MEKSGFQKSITPKHREQIYINYSSNWPQKIYYYRPPNKTTTQAVRPNIIRDYRKPNQSIEQLETKIGSSSPQVFEQDINKGHREANQHNEQLAIKKDIESLGVIIIQTMNQNIIKIGKEISTQISREIGKEIGNKLTEISQKLSDISKKINSNLSSGSLSRSKNSNGNNSIHSFPKNSHEKDFSSSHYNYKKRAYQ